MKPEYVKAITFRVASPIGITWPDLRAILSECWADSTALANWAVTAMAKADVVRMPDMKTLPPSPANRKGAAFYLYPEARRRFTAMDPHAVVAVLNTVQGNYRKRRKDVIWTGTQSLQRFRYPFPYMLPAATWSAAWLSDTEKAPVVNVRLRGQRFGLRLRAGKGFRRQLHEFSQILDGTAKQCQMDIFRERANLSDHRVGGADRVNGGGEKFGTNIVVKIVAKFPVTKRAADGELIVKTDRDSLLVLIQKDRELWRENADHVRGWIVAHSKRIQRLSDDLKFETRQGRRYQEIKDVMTRAQEKFANRMRSFIHEATAHVVGKALRGKCGKVIYDDSERGYMKGFQWHALGLTLKNKVEAEGMEFCERSGDAEAAQECSQEVTT